MKERHRHCGHCGAAFDEETPWPRDCEGCGNTSWINPLPVTLAVVPVGEAGVLAVRRGIEPQRGELAFPGGFLDVGETWQEGVVRELREETHLDLPAASVELFSVHTSLAGFILIIGKLPPIDEATLESFEPTDETTELAVIREAGELAFPGHTAALAEWFGEDA